MKIGLFAALFAAGALLFACTFGPAIGDECTTDSQCPDASACLKPPGPCGIQLCTGKKGACSVPCGAGTNCSAVRHGFVCDFGGCDGDAGICADPSTVGHYICN